MSDTVEMNDIRSEYRDNVLKGFSLVTYVFKNDCAVSTTPSMTIVWRQETAADLTATAPQYNANISPLSTFPTLEVSWTKNTSYVRKYGNEDFISMEDESDADVQVLARTLLRLTRAVAKQVDTRIFNVLTESLSPSNIQTFATTAVGGDQWDAASYAADITKDVTHAKKLIADYDYPINNLVLYLHQKGYESLVNWLVSGKGTAGSSAFPQFASEKIQTGTVMQFLGVTIKVSPNVTTDNAVMFIPNRSVEWKSFKPLTSAVIEEKGIGKRIRVWEEGEAILVEPKSVVLITDIDT